MFKILRFAQDDNGHLRMTKNNQPAAFRKLTGQI